MFLDQNGLCAICQTEVYLDGPYSANKAVVDHDHNCCPTQKSCGKCIRALLCSKCNPALGLMCDNPERLRAAAYYIENHTVHV